MRAKGFLLLVLGYLLVAGLLYAGIPTRYQEFAHIGDGGGLTTTFLVSNPGENGAQVDISFYRDDGSPWNLVVNGQEGAVYSLFLPPSGMARLRTEGASGTPSGGWARVTATEEVGAQVLFEIQVGGSLVTQAAVESTGPVRNADVFVVRNQAGGMNTGIAISALTEVGDTRVAFALYAADGNHVDNADLTLSPGQHVAKFVNELFSEVGDVTGTLRLSASGPVTITTLQQTGLVLGTLPPVILAY